MSAFQDMIRRVEFEDGEKNLALRRQFNERVRAARLTGGAHIVYYDPNNGKKIQKTRYEGEFQVNGYLPHGKGTCLLYTSPSPRDGLLSRMPSSA